MRYLNTKGILTISCFLLSFIIVLISCEKNEFTEDEYQIQYHREAQLKNTYKNEIIPLSEAFVTTSEALKNAIVLFNQDVTPQNLENARAKWIDMLKVWKQLELYNLGAVEDSYIHFEINRWPTNTERIEALIAENEAIDETFIESVGSSSKGISALEYLLYTADNSQDIIKTFTTDTNHQRRLDYLVALTLNLVTKAKALQTIWIADETAFISSLENGISGSQSQLTNAMITLTEEVIISKLGNALGDNSGGTIDIEKLEAYKSKSSLPIIEAHLIALKRCYKGNFKEDSIKWGYDDYLKLIGSEDLDAIIEDAFKVCQEKIDAIPTTLSETLLSNPQKVMDLQNAFTDLLVLLKVDLANTIGTTVTINDNDGD